MLLIKRRLPTQKPQRPVFSSASATLRLPQSLAVGAFADDPSEMNLSCFANYKKFLFCFPRDTHAIEACFDGLFCETDPQ